VWKSNTFFVSKRFIERVIDYSSRAFIKSNKDDTEPAIDGGVREFLIILNVTLVQGVFNKESKGCASYLYK